MKQPDLFGGMTEVIQKTPKSKYQLIKERNKYRRGDIKANCGNCAFKVKLTYHSKTYYKCENIGESHSEATDIRLKNVCNLWESDS